MGRSINEPVVVPSLYHYRSCVPARHPSLSSTKRLPRQRARSRTCRAVIPAGHYTPDAASAFTLFVTPYCIDSDL